MATAWHSVAHGVGVPRRRVFVPPEVAGLMAALERARCGDEAALGLWDREARPVLMRALRRSGFDAASADDAIMHLLEQADRAVRSGRTITHEVRWMSAVLASARREERRSVRRALAISRLLPGRTPWWCDPKSAEQDREELLLAASRLRPRFELAIRLRLRGLDARETRVALCVEFALGPEQARKIDRQALVLLRAALANRGT